MLEAERELFGWDHCEIGRQLIGDWKLPESFEAVVADHHSERRADGAWDVARTGEGELRHGFGGGLCRVSGMRDGELCRTA